jgi:hypothetical protein
MTYHLTHLGIGIATERTPVAAKGKVILTFLGAYADTVCIENRFYPIIGKRAEIPAEAFSDTTEITAHALAEGKRYSCDPIGRFTDGELSYLVPLVTRTADSTAAFLADLISDLETRVREMGEQIAALGARIEQKPFTFGGTV